MSNDTLSIQKNMLWNTVGSLVFLGCQWLTTILVVRLSSGYDAAGSLAVAMAVSNIFAPIALYKVRSFQVSDIEGEFSSGEYIAFRVVSIAAALVISIPYMLLTCAPADYAVVIAYLLFRVGEVFIDVLHGVDQRSLRMDYCGKSMALRGVLFLVAFAVALAATNSLLVAVIAMALCTYPVVLLDWRWAAQFESLTPQVNVAHMASLAKQCFPAVVGMVCSYAVTTLARQYLGMVQGNEMLGIYASVCTPVLIIQAGASYMYAPLLGPFARAFTEGNFSRFTSLLGRVCLGIVGISVVGAVGFFFLGEPFLSLVFGPEIVPYTYLLYAALVCTSFTAFISFLNDLMIVMREMRGNMVGNVCALAATVPFTMVAVAWWGMNGVSIAISAAYAVGIAIMLVVVARRLRTQRRVPEASPR